MRKQLYTADKPRLILSLLNYATLLLEMNQAGDAEIFLQEILTIQEEQQEQELLYLPDIYFTLGNIKLRQGFPKEALQNYHQANESLNAEARNTAIFWKIQQGIANTYQTMHDFDMAANYYEQAIQYFQGSIKEELLLKNNFASNQIYQDKLELASQIYHELIPIAENVSEFELAKTYHNFAGVLLQQTNINSDNLFLENIEYYLETAIKIYQKQEQTQVLEAKSWNRLGDCYIIQKAYLKAKQSYETAYLLDKTTLAKRHFKLARLAKNQQDYGLALYHLDQLETMPHDTLSFLIEKGECLTLGLLADQDYTWQQIRTVYGLARKQLLQQESMLQKMTSAIYLRNSYYQIYDGLVESSFAMQDSLAAFQYAQESKIGVLHRALTQGRNVADSLL